MAFGFLKTIVKAAAGVAGFAVGGPAGAVAGFTGASKVLDRPPAPPQSWEPPPAYIIPPPPLPPAPQLPYLAYSGGGAGASLNSTYAPPAESPGGANRASAPRKKAAKRKKKSGVKRHRKLKFGSAAYRKKYLGHR